MQSKVINSVVLVLLLSAVSKQSQWHYCKQCDCRHESIINTNLNVWKANCIRYFMTVTLMSIPANSEKQQLQAILFYGHSLQQLQQDAFIAAGLAHLKALTLKNCGIKYVHKHTFRGMTELISLDLSYNNIATLDDGTFNNSRLQRLNLRSNKIQSIEDGLFANLFYVKKVTLSNNKITNVSRHAFWNTLKLEELYLYNNKLTYMHPDIVTNLTLKELWLDDNRWHCDCHLTPLLNAVKNIPNNNLNFTRCKTPEELCEIPWSNLTNADFICPPVIQKLSVVGNATLICLVSGNPVATVHWEVTGKRIDNKLDKYVIGRLSTGDNLTVWHNLTILNATAQDSGQYTCTANNSAGQHSRYVTLQVPEQEQSVVVSNNWMDLQSRYVTLVVPEQEQSVAVSNNSMGLQSRYVTLVVPEQEQSATVPWMLVLYISLALLSVATFVVLITLVYTKCYRTKHSRQRDSPVPQIFELLARARRHEEPQTDEDIPLELVGAVREAH